MKYLWWRKQWKLETLRCLLYPDWNHLISIFSRYICTYSYSSELRIFKVYGKKGVPVWKRKFNFQPTLSALESDFNSPLENLRNPRSISFPFYHKFSGLPFFFFFIPHRLINLLCPKRRYSREKYLEIFSPFCEVLLSISWKAKPYLNEVPKAKICLEFR